MKSERIYIRVSKNEKQELERYALLSGKTISEYMITNSRRDIEKKKRIYKVEDNDSGKITPENKEKLVQVKFTKSGFKTLNERADKLNITISEYVRRATLHKRIFDFTFIRELTMELRKIGTNLNQLTHLANMEKIRVVNLKETKDEIAGIYGELRKLFRKNLY